MRHDVERDRRLIDLYEDAEVRSVARSLQCTEEQLREAAQAVGYSADEVCEHLKSRLWRAVSGHR